MHPSAMHTIGKTLVKLSSVNDDDSTIGEIGVLDEEITVGFVALENKNNASRRTHTN